MDEQHPDLLAIDRLVADRFQRVLRAEQEAAAVTRRRATSLRDRLIDLEESAAEVVVTHTAGTTAGVVRAVGLDVVEVATACGSALIPLAAVATVEPS